MAKHKWWWIGGLLLVAVVGVVVAWVYHPFTARQWGPPQDLLQDRTSEGYPALGDPQAPLNLFLYEDFASPKSKRLHDETEPPLLEHYVARHLVRLISVPIAAVGSDSYRAMAAALCMADFEKYWAYRDVLYAYQGRRPFTRENLAALATKVGISKEQFYSCYDLKRHADEISRWNDEAKAKGVQGAPTYEIPGKGLIPGFRPFDDAEMPGIRQILDVVLLEVMAK